MADATATATTTTDAEKQTRNREKKPGLITLETLASAGYVNWIDHSIKVVKPAVEGEPETTITVKLSYLVGLSEAGVNMVTNQYDDKAKENSRIRAIVKQLREMGLEAEAKKVESKLS